MTETATRNEVAQPTLDLPFANGACGPCTRPVGLSGDNPASGRGRAQDRWPPEGWPRDGWPPPELLPEQHWNAAMWEST